MPARLGQFYAFMLLLICLAVNITFFSEVRESFLGDADPLASVKSTISELDIKASIADFYPKVQSTVEDAQDHASSPAPPVENKAVFSDSNRQPLAPPAKPETPSAIVDPFSPAKPEPEKAAPQEEPKPPVAASVPAENHQAVASVPAPRPAAAVSRPVIADQFKPIMTEPKPAEPLQATKPSSSPVWDTVDTILERPVRND